jgi:hypothetical protein
MRTCGIISLGAISLSTVLLLAPITTASYAQSSSGTAPEDRGSTGWTGGSRDQLNQDKAGATSGQAPAPDSTRDTEAAKDQPLTATGEDLKGPAQRFPPSKTPE